MFYFYFMIGFLWSLYSHTIFLWCSNTKYLALIKRRSKVQKNNMPCERALNFNQWKSFSENYKPMIIWLWLVYKFTDNDCRWRLFSEFIQTQKGYPTCRQNAYPNLKTTCHIRLKFFLWAKPVESLLLAKYLIYVAAYLIRKTKNTHYSNLNVKNKVDIKSFGKQ